MSFVEFRSRLVGLQPSNFARFARPPEISGRMNSQLQSLTPKEKEALRLLLAGYDAKSSARELGLSVHTINERLRDARRKLGVSSSREAARLLAATEGTADNPLGYKQFGVTSDDSARQMPPAAGPRSPRARIIWTGAIVTLIASVIAAVLLLQGSGSAPTDSAAKTTNVRAEVAAAPAETSARAWLAFADKGDWQQTWATAATMFRSRVTGPEWAAMAGPVRQPLGKVLSRSLLHAQLTAELPGAPAGDYAVLQFATTFGVDTKAVETLTLVREGSDWKVAGYFVKPA